MCLAVGPTKSDAGPPVTPESVLVMHTAGSWYSLEPNEQNYISTYSDSMIEKMDIPHTDDVHRTGPAHHSGHGSMPVEAVQTRVHAA